MTNEVRVGNWVFADGVKVRVTPIMIAVSEGLGEICLKLTPIPITPEILEKAGFKLEFGGQLPDYIIRGGFCMYWDDEFLSANFGHVAQLDVEIKYLHQLQNLYYSLHGEELQIEL